MFFDKLTDLSRSFDVHGRMNRKQITLLGFVFLIASFPLVAMKHVYRPQAKKMNIIDMSLYIAAEKGHVDVVRALLNLKANPNSIYNKTGDTPLYVAARNGHQEIIAQLIAAGAEVNAPNTNLFTPLMVAAYQGYEGIVRILLLAGADPTIANDAGVTAWHLAKTDAIKRLLVEAEGMLLERTLEELEKGGE